MDFNGIRELLTREDALEMLNVISDTKMSKFLTISTFSIDFNDLIEILIESV